GRGRRRRSAAHACRRLSCRAPRDDDLRLGPAGPGRTGSNSLVGDVAARGGLDGGDDLDVARAAADVAAELLEDLVAARRRVALEQRGRREHEARRAEPALRAVLLMEGGLDFREAPRLAEALDGRDARAIDGRERD